MPAKTKIESEKILLFHRYCEILCFYKKDFLLKHNSFKKNNSSYSYYIA